MLKVFPRYDDGDDTTVKRISQRLQPLLQRLLQLGIAGLQSLKLDANIIACPKVLGQLPLRHLKLEIVNSSRAELEAVTAALSQCTTLEYLYIAGHMYSSRPKELPDLVMLKAPFLKRVHLLSCFPTRKLCLPLGCQLRLDLNDYPSSWDRIWQNENGRELMGCISAMRLKFHNKLPWPSSTRDFSTLQYLELQCPKDFTDLAQVESVPHVKLDIPHWHQGTISHTVGSWQSLEIYRHGGFEISFADIDTFVRSNPKFLFGTFKITKAWRSMCDALYAASETQCVGCFPHKSADGDYSTKLSNIKDVDKSRYETHLVCVEEFWPHQSMQSCLAPLAPRLKVIRVPFQRALQDVVNASNSGVAKVRGASVAKVNDPESPLSLAADPKALPTHTQRELAGQRTLWGRLTWLARKLNPIRSCVHGV